MEMVKAGRKEPNLHLLRLKRREEKLFKKLVGDMKVNNEGIMGQFDSHCL